MTGGHHGRARALEAHHFSPQQLQLKLLWWKVAGQSLTQETAAGPICQNWPSWTRTIQHRGAPVKDAPGMHAGSAAAWRFNPWHPPTKDLGREVARARHDKPLPARSARVTREGRIAPRRQSTCSLQSLHLQLKVLGWTEVGNTGAWKGAASLSGRRDWNAWRDPRPLLPGVSPSRPGPGRAGPSWPRHSFLPPTWSEASFSLL